MASNIRKAQSGNRSPKGAGAAGFSPTKLSAPSTSGKKRLPSKDVLSKVGAAQKMNFSSAKRRGR